MFYLVHTVWMRGSQGGPEAGDDAGREIDDARRAFGTELRRLREIAALSQRSLAKRISYHTSYISKAERAEINPTANFAMVADEALRAGGILLDRWQTYFALRQATSSGPATTSTSSGRPIAVSGTSHVINIKHERTRLTYNDGRYSVVVIREIENLTKEAINAYQVRVHVDVYPEDSERSREYYREHPLAWDDLGFRSWHGYSMADFDQDDRRPKAITELVVSGTQTVTDKIIEGWVLFEARHGETLPLHAGRRMVLKYEYTVDEGKWGTWLQRHMRMPTARLDVELDFPRRLYPRVWGKEVSMRNPRLVPIDSEISIESRGDRSLWSWTRTAPMVGDRYRFEWLFGEPPC